MILELIWSLLALCGFFRALYLLREAILDHRALGTIGNGRRTISNAQLEHVWMGVCMYFCMLCPGLLAVGYKMGMTNLEQRIDWVPFFLIAALILLVIRQERDAYYRRKVLGKTPPSNAIRKAIRWLYSRVHKGA